jgi:hypothetical protein
MRNVYKDPRLTWDLFEPTVDCTTKERIGHIGDGGKWLCNLRSVIQRRNPEPCVVYSFGVSNDVSLPAVKCTLLI